MQPYFKLGMDKEIIVPYAEYLAAMKPDFEYIGNKEDILDIVLNLSLPNVNSVKLVGNRGVGITTRVDALVKYQQADFMPDDIMTRPIYKLNAANLFNTSDAKAVESRFKAGLEKLKTISQQRRVKPILVLDDGCDFVENAPRHVINALVEAAIKADFVDLIVNIDAKKELDFDKKHPEFPNSFSRMKIKEPGKEQLLDIARYHTQKYTNDIIFSDEVLEHMINISQSYAGMYDTAQPNRLIRLLDSSATAFKMDLHSRPPGSRQDQETLDQLRVKLESEATTPDDKQSIQNQIEALEAQMASSAKEWKEHRDKIKDKTDSIRKYDNMIVQNQKEIEKLDDQTKENLYQMAFQAFKEIEAGHADFKGRPKEEVLKLDRDNLLAFADVDLNLERNPLIRDKEGENERYTANITTLQADLEKLKKEINVREEMPNAFVDLIATKETGSPVGGITGKILDNIKNGETLMKQSVFGQDRLIDRIIPPLKRAAAGLNDPNRPLGAFLIAGPPGNGKTFTGEQLADQLFGSSRYRRTIQMSNYATEHTVSELIGAPKGYKGYEEKPLLIQYAEEMPFGVLILDEIEKADKQIFQIFLDVLNKGECLSLNGFKADFRNMVIIGTSNYMQEIWTDYTDFEEGEKVFKERAKTGGKFPPEFLDRFDDIVATTHLDRNAHIKIAMKSLKTAQALVSRISKGRINIEYTEENITEFVDALRIGNSGRGTNRDVYNAFMNKVSNIILSDPKSSGVLSGRFDPSTLIFEFDYNQEAKPSSAPVNENVIGAAMPSPLAQNFSSNTLG